MSLPDFYLPLDSTGNNPTNLIVNEAHTLANTAYRLLFPKYGPYFTASLQVHAVDPDTQVKTLLTKNTHYHCIELLPKVTFELGKEVQAAILILDETISSQIEITYQALGGADNPNREILLEALDTLFDNSTAIQWNTIHKPKEFLPAPHLQDSADLYGLEYVSKALERVHAAILQTDDVFHAQLLAGLETAKNSFYDRFNLEINDQLDLIAQQAYSAQESQVLTHASLLETQQRLKVLNTQHTRNQQKLADYTLSNQHALKARILTLLSRGQHAFNGTVLDLPPRIEGLYCWLDFTDSTAVQVTDTALTIRDKSPYQRSFTSVNAAYGLNPTLNQLCAQFSTGSVFTQTQGEALHLQTPMTLFAITGSALGDERLTLLSNATEGLQVDIRENYTLRLGQLDGSQTQAKVRISDYDAEPLHLTVMGLSDDLKASVSYTNARESTYRHPKGFETYPVLNPQQYAFTQLGHSSLPQSGEVVSLLIYNRQLSECEIEAVLEYCYRRFNLQINLIGNGNFSSYLSEFETDYTLSLDAQNKGEIATIAKSVLLVCDNGAKPYYTYPNFMEYVAQTQDENRFLIVNTHLEADKAFWKQTLSMDPYITYEFAMTVFYNPENPPQLALWVDGLQKTVFTPELDSASPMQVRYRFKVYTSDATFELKNLNTSGDINTLAIDSIQLRRALY